MDLQCCLNGARLPAEHSALPVTPAQIRDAVAEVAGLVSSIHLHAKDDSGRDTLAATPVAATLRACRAAAPALPVSLTTGAWAAPDPADRVAAIQSWTVLPDLASVNWHEDGAEETAAALHARGVGIEAGIWHDRGLAAWAVSPLRDHCRRILVEIPDLPGQPALAAARTLVRRVREVSPAVEILLHGEDRSTWPVLREAAITGLSSRIGLEDALTLPNGQPAARNLDLVQAAHRLADEAGLSASPPAPDPGKP